jgi:hypothetical protein
VEKYGRANKTTDNIIRRMRIACWITKATHTHSEYVTLLFHGNIGYTNAAHCYIYAYIASLFNLEMVN